jgi:nucleoside-diphosphate-sugar epimerase
MRVLVTGGAGFVGSNLVRALLERGDEVVVLDSFSTGRRENLEDVLGDVELVEGDLRSYERVHEAVARTELVFHQGALPSVPRSVQDPLTTNAVNVEGTLNVLLAARDQSVRRIVFASSSSIYGDTPGLPRREDQRVSPIAPYAVSKLAAESYCTVFWRVYSLETVSLRYFNVFGPRQDPASQYAAVVPRFITRLLGDEPPVIEGDGEQSRDFTFVEQVVEANLLAAEAEGAAGETFNVAAGRSRTVNELATTLAATIGSDVEPVHVEARPGDVRESAADVGKARRLLGFEPGDSFESGLRATVEYFGQASSVQARARK